MVGLAAMARRWSRGAEASREEASHSMLITLYGRDMSRTLQQKVKAAPPQTAASASSRGVSTAALEPRCNPAEWPLRARRVSAAVCGRAEGWRGVAAQTIQRCPGRARHGIVAPVRRAGRGGAGDP